MTVHDIPRPRIAFVVQRYGPDVWGGAEQHCRMIAERLAHQYSVTILTTTALDGNTWRNSFHRGRTEERGLEIIRFPVLWPRLQSLGRVLRRLSHSAGQSTSLERLLPILDGPFAPSLVNSVRKNERRFDVFIFFCCTLYHTQAGIATVGKKSILVPTAHDVSAIAELATSRALAAPRFIFANTVEEQQLLTEHTNEPAKRIRVVGCGIDQPQIDDEPSPFSGPLILTVGRMKRGMRDVHILMRNFRERYGTTTFRDDNGDTFMGRELRYVLAGSGTEDIESTDAVIPIGPIDNPKKWGLIRQSLVVVNPSLRESLSLLLLEAWSMAKPVIVASATPALAGQCTRSGGGAAFNDPIEFSEKLAELLSNPQRRLQLGNAARTWASKEYQWDKILREYLNAIDEIVSSSDRTLSARD